MDLSQGSANATDIDFGQGKSQCYDPDAHGELFFTINIGW